MRPHLGIILAAVLAYFLLSPGIHGVFLLDDYPNLNRLELLSGGANLQQLLNFALSGDAGAGGRLISMLSFALQADAWPASAGTFKQVNLLLHLVNGLLVYGLVMQIGKHCRQGHDHAVWMALFVATVWLLHPLNVSTVFYVVQRMTELSTLFTLLGLLGYVYGRQLAGLGRKSGYVLSGSSILGGAALAVACKESGVLLPLYALALELTLFGAVSPGAQWPRWRLIFLTMPVVLVFGYLAFHFQDWIASAYSFRSFTLPERLLTEARALCSYLLQIVMPQPRELGLFHDDYPLSRSLFDPVSTAFACGFLLLALGVAVSFRKRLPLLSFGVLWFFAGHILESTVIPLEIYFEHRNYLPMVGVLYSFAGGALYAGKQMKNTPPMLLKAIAGGWMLLLIFVTWQQAVLWGNPARQAFEWANLHPDSERAQHHMAGVWIMDGRPDLAEAIYRKIAEGGGGNAGGYLVWLSAGCQSEQLALPDHGKLMQLLRSNIAFQHGLPGVLEGMVSAKEEHRCSRVDSPMLLQVIETLIANPVYASRRAGFLTLLGRLQMAEGKPDESLASYDKSIAFKPSAEVAMLKIKALVAGRRFEQARAAVAKARAINLRHSPAARRASYAFEIDRWEVAIDRAEKESVSGQ